MESEDTDTLYKSIITITIIIIILFF